jgi:ubiquinone/menaquinone biosynthesis C-methylase UbiE
LLISLNVKKKFLFDRSKIPFKNKSFDIVLCGFVLQHASNWKQLLGEIKRVGKTLIIIDNTPEIPID